ncbi:adenylyl cyclase-associated protein 2 isoform X2 [Trichechus manatus latirostris]|uniref:Adenylyl cyclase-associated protein 2 isoform X2 n=1 Tax=Trichechus manatus latirostris TaxID=127582 RepID=A0A2Y9FYV0_TRIMA|nr:adenylyl cyclase-associated protein 2 isoform X2 [Trichechus manatus latirostris]
MAEMQGLMERLEQAVVRLELLSAGSHRPPGDCGEVNDVNAGVAPSVEAFDKLMNSMVAEFLKNSRILAGDVETHAEMVHSAFQAQRAFLLMASRYQQPQENDVATLLKPISEKIQEIQTFREQNRGSDMFNHLSAVSESIPALGWIAVGPVASTASASAFSPGPGLPPPPPPPPPPGPPPLFGTEGGKEEPSPSRSALFAQLNQGEAITKGLRHVTDDQKTYKNPGLRAQGGQTRSPTKSHTPSPTSPTSYPPQKHAPVFELEGKKWRVEYQEDRNDLMITDAELKQVAYIFKCNKSTLQMKGKINSVTIDNCKKFGLVFDSVVGIVEVINAKDIYIQVMGKVPTISINKTEGCHIYLSEDALDCEIVSAKSSEMNILIPQDGDYREFPVPEQFKTTWNGSKLVTEPAEILA